MNAKTLLAGTTIALALTAAAVTPANAAITTFATTSALTADNLYFKNGATNNKSSSATVYSIPTATSKTSGSVHVDFSFINEGTALDAAVSSVTAIFKLNGSEASTPAILAGGYVIQLGLSGSFSYLSTTAITVGHHTYAAGSNLLSAIFTGGSVAGPNNSTSGSLDANNENSGSTLVYTSDFISFSPTATEDASYNLTSITPPLSDIKAGTYGLKTFATDAGGSFSADPTPHVNAVPEPASWALMIVGFGLAGASMRRRIRVQTAA